LTGHLHKGISTQTTSFLYGRRNTKYSETEVGRKQESVPIVRSIKTVREMGFIIGMARRKMYSFVITSN
jgi:hypothetical protein